MEFFKTKAGGLTIAFAVIMIAFVMIMAGLGSGNDMFCTIAIGLIAFVFVAL